MPIIPSFELYIDPPSQHFLGDRLFEADTARLGGDNILGPWIELRRFMAERGVPVHTADLLPDRGSAGRKGYISLGMLDRYRELAARDDVTASAFIAMECPIVEPSIYRALPDVARHFRRVLSWTDTASLLPFTGQPVAVERFFWPQAYDDVNDAARARTDRGFLAMINANKLPRVYDCELYTERLRAIEFFNRFGEVHLYGRNWSRMPNRVGREWLPATARRVQRVFWEAKQRRWPDPLYSAAAAADRGPVDSKIATLAGYRFALCFENMTLKGWITEKIFDCFFAGTIPVYWGAPDIAEWVPADCFIDMRRFPDYAALRDHLHSLGSEEVSYYREAARAFIRSSAFDRFRATTLVRQLWSYLEHDLGADAHVADVA